MVIYLAGGLFNVSDRLHNLFLEKYLKELGHTVILPQRRALKFFDGGTFDTDAIVKDCMELCADRSVLCVVNIDGPDADSGAAIEYATAIAATRRAAIYRTDFRTAPEKELGVNAMFRAYRTLGVYLPCYFTELSEIDAYYRELAQKIDAAISFLMSADR
jgi:nucleoside 2-deoxyribosyltransferase